MKPKPFCFNKSKIKAFVLGADPTNFSDGGTRVDLTYAFGIGQNPNYFRVILQNLNEIGLHLEDIYIQNLLPNYQEQETGKNLSFINTAAINAKAIAAEFNKVDPAKTIPVFLTAYDVYKAVLKEDYKCFKAADLYSLKTEIPISPLANNLGRPIIPLFRHGKYILTRYDNYKQEIMNFFTGFTRDKMIEH